MLGIILSSVVGSFNGDMKPDLLTEDSKGNLTLRIAQQRYKKIPPPPCRPLLPV